MTSCRQGRARCRPAAAAFHPAPIGTLFPARQCPCCYRCRQHPNMHADSQTHVHYGVHAPPLPPTTSRELPGTRLGAMISSLFLLLFAQPCSASSNRAADLSSSSYVHEPRTKSTNERPYPQREMGSVPYRGHVTPEPPGRRVASNIGPVCSALSYRRPCARDVHFPSSGFGFQG